MNADELVVGIPNTQVRFTLSWNNPRVELLPNSHYLLSFWSQLSDQRVYNLSRTRRSQVQQVLRVSYEDAAKIPKFLESIKEEIRNSCPKLITDGSRWVRAYIRLNQTPTCTNSVISILHRPFRAHWRNYEDDHLEIVVDAHFTIPPTGNEYWDNRQSMLEAISHAAKKSGVRLERAVKQGWWARCENISVFRSCHVREDIY